MLDSVSMMFVKADAFDVVPRSCLMAEEALVHLGLLHAGGRHRNHFEVHHVMARRGLVTLGAVQGSWRGMAEFGNGPCDRAVTLRAILPEQSAMPVLVPVASGAIQNRFLRRQAGAPRLGSSVAGFLIDPAQEVCGGQAVFSFGVGIVFELPEADARQCRMIHRSQSFAKTTMFAVALAATAHVGMEGRRLALQERGVIRVADNATGGLDSFAGRVAGGAVVFQKCVALGERTGTGHALPGRLVQDAGAHAAGMTSQEVKSRKQRHEQRQRDE